MPEEQCLYTEILQHHFAHRLNLLPVKESKGHHHINTQEGTISVLLASKQQKSNIMIKCNSQALSDSIPV